MKINWSFIEPVRDQAARLRGDYSAQSAIVKLAEQQAEIERLREENVRLAALSAKASLEASQLRQALEPFAEMLKGHYSHQSDDMPIKAGANQYDLVFGFTLGDLRAARAAIREGEPK